MNQKPAGLLMHGSGAVQAKAADHAQRLLDVLRA